MTNKTIQRKKVGNIRKEVVMMTVSKLLSELS